MPSDDQNKNNDPVAGEKKGTTLNMENLAINTMGEDLSKSGVKEEVKGSWLNFIAKHKKTPGSDMPPPGVKLANPQTVPTKETPPSALDNDLAQFKAESDERAKQAEHPLNLPVTKAKTENGAAQTGNTDLDPGKQLMDSLIDKSSQQAEKSETDQALPSLKFEEGKSSQKVKKPVPAQDDKAVKASFRPTTLQEQLSGILEGKRIDQGENQSATSGKPALVMKEEAAPGIAESSSPAKEEENPFSAKLPAKPLEGKSLLSSVESALNYSASPEFAAKREQSATENQEESKVVDLRSRQDQSSQSFIQKVLKDKKLLIIAGGAVGGVAVLVIVLILVFSRGGGGGSSRVATLGQNKNENQNLAIPIKPVVTPPVTQPVEPLFPKEFLTVKQNVTISSAADLASQLDVIQQGPAVTKQTQLVLLKSDGSAVAFEDLIDAENVIIPSRILADPSKEPAMLLADFFGEKTVFGLVIPVKGSESQALSDMKVWETTMVADLKFLWKGIQIDNPNAYFADSQIFTGGRFALIDKARGLSLDYLVEKSHIFIACGKDSLEILRKNFVAPAATSGSASSTGVDGMPVQDVSSNSLSNPSANSSLDSGLGGKGKMSEPIN